MVDAAHAFDRGGAAARPTVRAAGADLVPEVSTATREAEVAYSSLAETGIAAPAQSPSWVEAWVRNVNRDAILASLVDNGLPVLTLALEVVDLGPCRVARFMGGTHANGNFPALQPAWASRIPASALRQLVDAVAKTRPDIDMIALERLRPDLDGVANPLTNLPSFRSANLSLAVDLDGGFDALLARSSGKRKRKKFRSQSRKFEAAGGFRRILARSHEDIDRLLAAFFAMKEIRFRKAGIRDVFADEGVRAFFRDLFVGAAGQSRPAFQLHGLEVGGTLRAITGSSLRGDTLTCEFGAIIEDELASASPGDFLFFENIREACDDGLAVYDFSVGDELYKRLWCDIETQHVDVVLPLSLKGRALAQWLRLSARGKSFVKNSPMIWRLTKALRRRGAAAADPERADD